MRAPLVRINKTDLCIKKRNSSLSVNVCCSPEQLPTLRMLIVRTQISSTSFMTVIIVSCSRNRRKIVDVNGVSRQEQ